MKNVTIKAMLERMLGDYRSKQLSENNHLTDSQIDNIIRKIEEQVENEAPPRVAFIGETGVGKSSTLNALFNAGLEVSPTEACTQQEQLIEIKTETVEGTYGLLVAYDMPGLGESVSSRGKHLKTYSRVLQDVDVALWILDAQDRAIEFVQERLAGEIKDISRSLAERMVFALNKVDLVYPGETHWHPLANLPDPEQEQNIKARIRDVQKKIREALPTWRGTVIGYSANRRYNLPQLFSVMLDAVPEQRQWVLSSRKALADFFELVDTQLLSSVEGEVSIPKRHVVVKESNGQRMARLVRDLPPEEFKKATSSKEGLEEWLKRNFN